MYSWIVGHALALAHRPRAHRERIGVVVVVVVMVV
jgi:hypothetical protein